MINVVTDWGPIWPGYVSLSDISQQQEGLARVHQQMQLYKKDEAVEEYFSKNNNKGLAANRKARAIGWDQIDSANQKPVFQSLHL